MTRIQFMVEVSRAGNVHTVWFLFYCWLGRSGQCRFSLLGNISICAPLIVRCENSHAKKKKVLMLVFTFRITIWMCVNFLLVLFSKKPALETFSNRSVRVLVTPAGWDHWPLCVCWCGILQDVPNLVKLSCLWLQQVESEACQTCWGNKGLWSELQFFVYLYLIKMDELC